MLAARHRLVDGDDFRRVVRRGRRAGGRHLVVHLWGPHGPETATRAGSRAVAGVPRVGFVVSRAVGPAVVRNQVKRRLRHLMRDRLATLPAEGLVVVRALPSAGQASSATLGADLDHALSRVLGAGGPSGAGGAIGAPRR